MNHVSKTAFYCCAVREWDAESEAPICGDLYAKVFMDQEARMLMEPFRSETNPNRSNAARHRIIDDRLREQLTADPKRLIVIIGAGFDARAFRLPSGTWVEVDEPQIIDYKNNKLPAESAPNPLTRIPIVFGTESLEGVLAPYRGTAKVTVVIEGVLSYLNRVQIERLFGTLTEVFPRHTLLADTVSATFIRRYGRGLRNRLAGLGATMGDLLEDPSEPFRSAGYRLVESTSMITWLRDRNVLRIPRFFLKTFLKPLAEGYRVWEWER